MKYVIFDTIGNGWATLNPMEGWIFTRIKTNAFVFNNIAEAEHVIRSFYNYPNMSLTIMETENDT